MYIIAPYGLILDGVSRPFGEALRPWSHQAKRREDGVVNFTGIKLAVPAGVLFIVTFILWRTDDSVLVGLPSTVLALAAMNIVSLAFAIAYVRLRNGDVHRPDHQTGQ